MKLYKKEDLTFKDGYLVVDETNEIINVDPEVALQANQLETLYQEAEYLAGQPEFSPGPSLDGFVREGIREMPMFRCETPLNDAEVEHSMKLMNELDRAQVTERMNDRLKTLVDLIAFVRSDEVLSVDGPSGRFDTPHLGDPLTWNTGFIMEKVAFTFPGVELDELKEE